MEEKKEYKIMKKLVAKEFVLTEDFCGYEKGEAYSFYQDPETKKYYRPRRGHIIIGSDLTNHFIEVKPTKNIPSIEVKERR